MNKARYYCVVCGYKTLELYKEWDICPICRWEDDVMGDRDTSSPANGGLTLSQAQANFMLFGAAHKGRSQRARPPGPKDRRKRGWKPLEKAAELYRRASGQTDQG